MLIFNKTVQNIQSACLDIKYQVNFLHIQGSYSTVIPSSTKEQ